MTFKKTYIFEGGKLLPKVLLLKNIVIGLMLCYIIPWKQITGLIGVFFLT